MLFTIQIQSIVIHIINTSFFLITNREGMIFDETICNSHDTGNNNDWRGLRLSRSTTPRTAS